ncbi:MAG: DUF1801 domain-containing protein [Chloroflexi bacterium]|nr:DUF1801 domain-containing protein [Chloroflexota bacterium]OJV91878.1 MAG: hypothetical protein BGO39_14210 [Chloroflexi bacterium 54-19]
MIQNKTVPTGDSVEQFLNSLESEQKRKDSFALLKLMREVTGLEPAMWGASIVGFGSYHYKYASGREGDSMLIGFSPRKQNLAIYNMGGLEQDGNLAEKLGKYTTGKGCLYIKSLDEVDLSNLKELIQAAFERKVQAEP